MAKRNSRTTQANDETATNASGTTPANAMEQRLVAFADQLGRIVGTIQGKAEGWMDRETLKQQIGSVRDGAAHLLEQLADGVRTTANETPGTGPARGRKQARSGGVVDAPGKKHRKPPQRDPGANVAHSQASKLRAAKTMAKTNRRRGRG
jgi:hypothetical protein